MVSIQSKVFKSLPLVLCFIAVFFFCPFSLFANSGKVRPHGDKNELPKGCGSCHVGHGKPGTSMLPETQATFCYRCHGHRDNTQNTKRLGYLSRDAETIDIQREFEKPYRHPIETAGLHRYGEVLPETDPSVPRHVACGDCHHHHLASGANKMSGIKGTTVHRAKVSVQFDYELCFNCHAFSANLPVDQTNKADLFNVTNPSFHPVIGQGKNKNVPSLILPWTTSSTIKCTDCHNNNDPSGPKGPHGSVYQHLLSKNFEESDGSESSTRYELCYSCHRRESILGNQSFAFHDLHISQVGTSCRTCHNPHGNKRNAHLIDFDYSLTPMVRPTNTGHLQYISLAEKTGQCYLNCHNHEHDPATYPFAGSSPSATPATTLRKKK